MFVTILYTPFGAKGPEMLRRDKVLFADKQFALTRHGKGHYSTWHLPSGTFGHFSSPERVRGRDIRLAAASLARLSPRAAKKQDPTTQYRARREPFKSRWNRLHVKHLAALKAKDYGAAVTLADQKYDLFLKDRTAR